MHQRKSDDRRTTRLGPRVRPFAGVLCMLAAGTTLAQSNPAPARPPARPPSAIVQELSGSVLALNWADPIVELQLLTDDGAVWHVRTESLTALSLLGIGRHMFDAGTAIKVAGWVELGHENVLQATNVLISPSREIVLRRGVRRRWIGAPP